MFPLIIAPHCTAASLCSRAAPLRPQSWKLRIGAALPIAPRSRDKLRADLRFIDQHPILRPLALILLGNDLSDNGFVKRSEVPAAPEIPE